MLRRHLTETEKERLRNDYEYREAWQLNLKNYVLQAVGYGITPVILFAYTAIAFSETSISVFLLLLSFYWIVLCVIGISKLCKITKLESIISLIVPIFMIIILIFSLI
jgi:purine-cytosine permease-like protein